MFKGDLAKMISSNNYNRELLQIAGTTQKIISYAEQVVVFLQFHI